MAEEHPNGSNPFHDLLAKSETLPEFLNKADRRDNVLNLAERRLLVEQALVLFEQNYVHMPLKVAMHAVNPVQRLRLMRNKLGRQRNTELPPEREFHAELLSIFHSVRDLHMNYILPPPFSGRFAYLPFQIEEYYDPDGIQTYAMTRVVQGFSAPGLKPPATVISWNGIPIDRAVEINADRFAGSNLAARHAFGVDSLTVRPLRRHLPPDEEWVDLRYVGPDGVTHEHREPWRVTSTEPTFVPIADSNIADATVPGVDTDMEEIGRAKLLLFVPDVLDRLRQSRAGIAPIPDVSDATAEPVSPAPGAPAAPDAPTTPVSPEIEVIEDLADVFRARRVTIKGREYGHLRIFNFRPLPPVFLRELIRLLEALPRDGLIVDLRGNSGGNLNSSEMALQTLTPRRIVPEPMQLINTPLNLRICQAHAEAPLGTNLKPWIASMDQALETGATFSAAFPLTPEAAANQRGQRYHGPVVLVIDARCYSAGDTFAAGFQDHEIGDVLGVDPNTGAGGANVWQHQVLWSFLELPSPDPTSPYEVLPKDAAMRVSFRRNLRVGTIAGTPVEDLGVAANERHATTLNDLLHDNADLLERAAALLASKPVYALTVKASPGEAGAVQLKIEGSANLESADVYVDKRPLQTVTLAGAAVTVSLTASSRQRELRVEAFAAGTLAAARTLQIVATAPRAEGNGSPG